MTVYLCDSDEPIRECTDEIDIPQWISQDITPSDVAAIVQGGCESGAYMPAVTYFTALGTMHACGDDVLAYIDEHVGLAEIRIPENLQGSWSGLSTAYLSAAVEIWAQSIHDDLAELLNSSDDDD